VKVVYVARKLSTIEKRQDQICFGEETTGTKATTSKKSVLGSSPGEDVGFRDNNFFLRYSKIRI
jgi:hypothetical protein